MYGSVVHWRFAPGSQERVLRAIREEIVPALTQQPGFRRVSVFQSGQDTMISVIVYASQAAAEPAFARMAAFTRDQLGDLVVDLQRSAGDLIVDEAGASEPPRQA